MPKKKEPKLTERKDGRAVVHWKGKMHVMGKTGTREAKIAFHRFCAELQSNPTGFIPPTKEADATVKELGAAFLTTWKSVPTKQITLCTGYLLSNF